MAKSKCSVACMGLKLAKYILIFCNAIFWLTGSALIAIGIYLLVDKDILEMIEIVEVDSTDRYLNQVAYLLIGAGTFVFIVGCLGCCGAVRESPQLLCLFGFLLLLVMGVEIAAGALGWIYRDRLQTALESRLMKSITEQYMENSTVAAAWRFTQIKFACCGVNGGIDYKVSKWYNLTRRLDGGLNRESVPKSCCKTKHRYFYHTTYLDQQTCQLEYGSLIDGLSHNRTDYLLSKYANTQGCVDGVKNWVKSNLQIVLAVGLSVASVEIILLTLTCCMCFVIRKEAMGPSHVK